MAADVDEAHRVERIGGIADMVEAGMRLRDEDARDLLAAFRASRAEADLLRGLLREARAELHLEAAWQQAGLAGAGGPPQPQSLVGRIDAAIGGASGE